MPDLHDKMGTGGTFAVGWAAVGWQQRVLGFKGFKPSPAAGKTLLSMVEGRGVEMSPAKQVVARGGHGAWSCPYGPRHGGTASVAAPGEQQPSPVGCLRLPWLPSPLQLRGLPRPSVTTWSGGVALR